MTGAMRLGEPPALRPVDIAATAHDPVGAPPPAKAFAAMLATQAGPPAPDATIAISAAEPLPVEKEALLFARDDAPTPACDAAPPQDDMTQRDDTAQRDDQSPIVALLIAAAPALPPLEPAPLRPVPALTADAPAALAAPGPLALRSAHPPRQPARTAAAQPSAAPPAPALPASLDASAPLAVREPAVREPAGHDAAALAVLVARVDPAPTVVGGATGDRPLAIAPAPETRPDAESLLAQRLAAAVPRIITDAGQQQLVLTPATLGAVTIRWQRDSDGTPCFTLTAREPAAAQLLDAAQGDLARLIAISSDNAPARITVERSLSGNGGDFSASTGRDTGQSPPHHPLKFAQPVPIQSARAPAVTAPDDPPAVTLVARTPDRFA
jgi:hypothetical protein